MIAQLQRCCAVSIGHSFSDKHLTKPLHGPFFARIPAARMVTMAVQSKHLALLVNPFVKFHEELDNVYEKFFLCTSRIKE
jgi:hypothetical protein